MMSDWLAAFGAPYGGGKRGCGGLAFDRGIGRTVGARDDTGHKRLDTDQALDHSPGLKAQYDRDSPIDPA